MLKDFFGGGRWWEIVSRLFYFFFEISAPSDGSVFNNFVSPCRAVFVG